MSIEQLQGKWHSRGLSAQEADQLIDGLVRESAQMRADRDSWRDQCSERVKDWDEMRQECEQLHALIAAKNDMLREATEYLETDAIQPRGGLHQAMKSVLALTDAQPAAEQHDSDGWRQSGGLLYRLTDEQHPQNRDEINVTMANGSRADEAREQRAREILGMLTRSPEQPQAQAEPVAYMTKQGARTFLMLAHNEYVNRRGIKWDDITALYTQPRAAVPDGLTFADLRAADAARIGDFRSSVGSCLDWTLSDWMTALAGEVGEAANIIKKVRRGDFTIDEAREALAKEYADIQTYLDIIAYRSGIDLGAATVRKFNEVSERIGSNVRLSPTPPTGGAA